MNLGRILEPTEVFAPVEIVDEDLLAVMAALDDVIGVACDHLPRNARH